MFTTAICPGLLNVCSQKRGQMKKMEVGKKTKPKPGGMCKEGYTNATIAITFHIHMAKSPFAAGQGLIPCMDMGKGVLGPCTSADFPQCLHHIGQTNPFFIFNFSFSYLGSLLSPTPSMVHAYLNRKTIVLRDPGSFHPVTLCRANHSLNVLTVKLLLSLLFSTKFSHNNPLSYFLPIKYMNS